MLELVLLNFAVNARDAMPRGGCLRVRTESVQLNDSDARRHPEARPGQFVSLTITDTGRGMDARTLSRIFEPFFSTKEFGASSGLGLATVYGVVQQHQGWIQAASQPGKGTTFQVFLPVETAAPPAPGPSRPGAHTAGVTASGGEETILLVEDEPSLRELVKVILKARGYQVIEAGSGPEALQVYEKHQGKINLLLTDMVMPGGLSGTDVAVQLQSLTPELKVLFTSGYSLDLVRGDFSLKPGLNFIPKPYTATALTKAVRESLDR
jgi:CheY-like chemotaxis protein